MRLKDADQHCAHAEKTARSCVFLQGVRSPFFGRLASRLHAEGVRVTKVHFTGGDELYWPRNIASIPFRQPLDCIEEFYRSLFDARAATDIVLFGDSRPIHVAAVRVARQMGIRVHVFEEGYFRPYWITLECGGVNANSQLPKDPDWYLRARDIPEFGNGRPFKSSFIVRAWHDVLYNSISLADFRRYPHYRTHNPVPIWKEYAGYLKRGWKLRRRTSADARQVADLARKKRAFYLLALQLNSDAQIQRHSRFKSMRDVMQLVLPSFAEHAPAHSILVIKNHPLDPGVDEHEQMAVSMGRELGISRRLIFLESGHLPTLLAHTAGVVVVNSTVGGSALLHGVPTIALGNAIFNIPGLTFQGPLDSFWEQGETPDMKLFRKFRNVVIYTTQVNGGFYTKQGIDLAVENCVPRLLLRQTPFELLAGPSRSPAQGG